MLWPGVWVRLISGDRLTLFTRPTKTRNGVFGTELAGVILGLDCAGAQAHFLAERCREQGGAMVVAVQSADCLRKAVERSGAAALSSAIITSYTYRHQCLADFKRVFGSGEDVAAGAGHRSNKSQRRYASPTQGRSSRGLLQVFNRDHPDLAELIGETAYSVLSKHLHLP